MTRTSAIRSVSAILATVALGLAGPAAGAKPIDTGSEGSFAAASARATPADSPSPAGHTSGDAISDWELVGASGAASLALAGAGLTLVTTRHRRQRRTAGPPNVAA
jgi:hypothetical protein